MNHGAAAMSGSASGGGKAAAAVPCTEEDVDFRSAVKACEAAGEASRVEAMIDRAYHEGIAALAEPSISAPGREALTALATAAVRRQA